MYVYNLLMIATKIANLYFSNKFREFDHLSTLSTLSLKKITKELHMRAREYYFLGALIIEVQENKFLDEPFCKYLFY